MSPRELDILPNLRIPRAFLLPVTRHTMRGFVTSLFPTPCIIHPSQGVGERLKGRKGAEH